jgi:hypothetical protein
LMIHFELNFPSLSSFHEDSILLSNFHEFVN